MLLVASNAQHNELIDLWIIEKKTHIIRWESKAQRNKTFFNKKNVYLQFQLQMESY